MKKYIFAIIFILYMGSDVFASQFTSNYNLEIPSVASRDWSAAISRDLVSIDSALQILSNDTAWKDAGTSVYLKTLTDKVGIGTASPSTALDVVGTLSVDNISVDSLITKQPWVDVRAYGAVGDSSADDTAALQKALDSCITGDVVFFPNTSGYYKITDALSIDVSDFITLRFEDNAKIKQTATGKDLLYITKNYITVENAILEGTGSFVTTGSSGAILIYSTGSYNVIRDCHLINPEQTAIKLDSTNYDMVMNNVVEGGPYFSSTAAIGSSRQHYGIWFKDCNYWSCLNNVIKPNDAGGVVIEGINTSTGTSTTGARAIGNIVNNCWDHGFYCRTENSIFSNNILYGCGLKVEMYGDTDETRLGNIICNNLINIGGAGSKPLSGDTGINMSNSRNCVISNNSIYSATDEGILNSVEDASYPIINNNITNNLINKVTRGNGGNAHGVEITGGATVFRNNNISNNLILDVGEDTSGNNMGIQITPADNDNHVANRICDNTLNNISEYGIYLSYLTDVELINNHFMSVDTANINLVDTTLVSENIQSNVGVSGDATFYSGVGIGKSPETGVKMNLARGNGASQIINETYSGTTSNASTIIFKKSSSDVIDTISQTMDGDNLGKIYMYGVDATGTFDAGAYIVATQSGSAGGKVPTNLAFSTHSSSAENANQLVLNTNSYTGINNASPIVTLDVVGMVSADAYRFDATIKSFDVAEKGAGLYVSRDASGDYGHLIFYNGKDWYKVSLE